MSRSYLVYTVGSKALRTGQSLRERQVSVSAAAVTQPAVEPQAAGRTVLRAEEGGPQDFPADPQRLSHRLAATLGSWNFLTCAR